MRKRRPIKRVLQKRLLTLSLAFFAASCKPASDAFIQGDIRIIPPVQLVQNDSVRGVNEGGTTWAPDARVVPPVQPVKEDFIGGVRYFNDGGTTGITIVDSAGKRFDVFFDRRFRVADGRIVGIEPGTIYLNAYPDWSNSVLVVHQAVFREKILKWVDQDGLGPRGGLSDSKGRVY